MIFYDEPADMLYRSVTSLHGAVDHLVAVDGGFFLYPHALPASEIEMRRAVFEAAAAVRIGLTLHVPSEVWSGNEVAKRNHALALAEAVTDPEGWYYVHDADNVVTHVAEDWFERVAEVSKAQWGVIQTGMREIRPDQDPSEGSQPLCNMYRALPGLAYGPNHYTLHAWDPNASELVCVWGNSTVGSLGVYDACHLLWAEHRPGERPRHRMKAKEGYYKRRDALGVEKLRYDPDA